MLEVSTRQERVPCCPWTPGAGVATISPEHAGLGRVVVWGLWTPFPCGCSSGGQGDVEAEGEAAGEAETEGTRATQKAWSGRICFQ